MPTDLEIAWLAGLIDGEGCIAFMRRTDYDQRQHLVRYDVKLAMACEDTVRLVHEIVAEIIGEDLVKVFEERRRVRRRRPLWRCEVSSKEGVYNLLSTLVPHMRTKRLEAKLCLRYLWAARNYKRYRTTEYDRNLAECATALRNGCRGAQAEARELLGQVILSEATEGFGSVERAEARRKSPNNNSAHERPAPHPRDAEGEDMVQSSGEIRRDGINSRRLPH